MGWEVGALLSPAAYKKAKPSKARKSARNTFLGGRQLSDVQDFISLHGPDILVGESDYRDGSSFGCNEFNFIGF